MILLRNIGLATNLPTRRQVTLMALINTRIKYELQFHLTPLEGQVRKNRWLG